MILALFTLTITGLAAAREVASAWILWRLRKLRASDEAAGRMRAGPPGEDGPIS